MPVFKPIKRNELIRYLRKLGFSGPFSGGKHQFMVKERNRLRIPNPHKSDISINVLNQILKQAGICRTEWENL